MTFSDFVIKLHTTTIAVLDALVVIAERIVLLAITGGAIWFGWRLLQTPDPTSKFQVSHMMEVTALIHDKWRTPLVLAFPLFYKTIKVFVDEVEEFAGMKRRKTPQQDQRVANPPPNPDQP